MGTRVLLIYPPSGLMNREDRCQVPSKNLAVAPPLPPTDLMYLAAVAEKAGCECRIVDYSLYDQPVEDLIKDLKEFSPDYLLISTTTPTLRADLQTCEVARGVLPAVRTIAKGAHFLKFNVEVLKDFPALDMIMRGETEATFVDIVTGTEMSSIAGLTWRGPDGPVNNPDRGYIEDLDSLPFPARHLVDNTLYVRPDNGNIQGTIKVARGCPFNCFFCLATPVSGATVRKRSPANILEEIKHCMEEYGMRDFLFWSDIFNLDRAWVMELCEAIIGSGLKFNWATNTRADTIDLEMAKLMRKAGCTLVSIGIESGSEEILEKMGKKLDIPRIKEAFRILKKAKIRTFAYYIVGLSWETRETFEETIRLAIELDSDFANFFTATAFPGTSFFDYALENGLFVDGMGGDLYDESYFYPTVKGHYLSRDEIMAFHEEAVRRFFFRPGYIFKRLLGIRSLKELFNYTRAGIAVLGNRRQDK